MLGSGENAYLAGKMAVSPMRRSSCDFDHNLGTKGLSASRWVTISTSTRGLTDNYPVNPLQIVQCRELDQEFSALAAHIHLDAGIEAFLE